jgi:hypothetical protein
LLLAGIGLEGAFLALGAGRASAPPLGQSWSAAAGLATLFLGLVLAARRDGPYPTREVAALSSSIVAAALAASSVIAASRGAAPAALAVLAVTGIVEVLVSAAFALRAAVEERPARAFLLPGVALASLSGVFFLGVLVLGGV